MGLTIWEAEDLVHNCFHQEKENKPYTSKQKAELEKIFDAQPLTMIIAILHYSEYLRNERNSGGVI